MAVSTIDALYNGGSEKVTATATGIDVTGTVTADGLTVQATSGSSTGVIRSASGSNSTLYLDTQDTTSLSYITASGSLGIATGSGTPERLRVDASGNLLVGQSSTTVPGAGNTTAGTSIRGTDGVFISRTTSDTSASALQVNKTTGQGAVINIASGGTTVGSIGALSGDVYIQGPTNHSGIQFNTNGVLPLRNSAIVDNTLDVGGSSYRWKDLYLSGDTFVGEPSTIGAGETGVTVRGLGQIRVGRSGTASATLVSFNNANGEVGRITTSGSSTSYVTSSDYRLKTDAQPMTGASARVQALNPVNFEWIADGTRVDGFLAHEAQEVVPEAVTGTKDAMRDEEYEVTPALYEDVVIPAVLDEDGNELEAERTEQQLVTEAVMGTRSVPDYQGIDQSKLVPLLTAALQEALTEITALKARVTALEG